MSHKGPHTRTERYETIVIGGGQAGLAAARELQGRDVDYLVLDPGMILPADPAYVVDKGEVAASLAAYVAHFDLALRLGVSVRSLRRAGEHFEILASDLRYEATSVIVAIGPYQTPLDLGWIVDGEPCLYFLGDVGRGAACIAARIAAPGL